jgi:hypothetical protein
VIIASDRPNSVLLSDGDILNEGDEVAGGVVSVIDRRGFTLLKDGVEFRYRIRETR